MGKNKWKNFCIVGLGNHAKTKLIPALKNNKLHIEGLVTSQKKIFEIDAKIFMNINEALLNLSRNTVFVISSPPHIHFSQIKQIINNGNDVIVEKPSFISLNEINEINDLLNNNTNVLIEAFMYKHSLLYKKFINFWNKAKTKATHINIIFCIPSYPMNTYRDKNNIESSCLYDLGCYGFSVLSEMDLDFKNLKLLKVKRQKYFIDSIHIGGQIDDLSVNMEFGVGEMYKNSVEIMTENGDKHKFSPFFYGRAADKIIQLRDKNNQIISKQIIPDVNSFDIMFGRSRLNWYKSQQDRLKKMIMVTKKLEEISKSISN